MYENIMLAVDLNHDESWNEALPVALAGCRQFGARLHVVTCLPELHLPLIAAHFPEGFAHKLTLETEEHLEAFVKEHVPGDVEVVHKLLAGDAIWKMIVGYAEEHDVDLIVLEAYRPDLKDRLIGSTAEKVARHAKRSVLIVRK